MIPTSSALYVYDITVTGGAAELPVVTEAEFTAAVQQSRALPSVPEDLNFGEREQEGWYWFAPAEGPLFVNSYAAWGVRRFTKKPPPELITRLVSAEERRRKDLIEAGDMQPEERLSGEMRKAYREDVEKSLLKRMPPSIVETPLLVETDPTGWRLYLFSSSDSLRDRLRTRVSKALAHLVGRPLDTSERTLATYLDESRPGVVLPAENGPRFLAWIAKQASATPWCRIPTNDGRQLVFAVEIEDALELGYQDGTVKVNGAEAVDRFASDAVADSEDDDGEGGLTISTIRLRLSIPSADDRRFIVRLDGNGRVLSMRVGSPMVLDDARDGIEKAQANLLLSASDLALGHRLVVALFEAYNYGYLQEWVEGTPQTQLWPGQALGEAIWSKEEPAIRGNLPLFDRPTLPHWEAPPPEQPPLVPMAAAPINAHERELVAAGNPTGAIDAYRERTGAGLEETVKLFARFGAPVVAMKKTPKRAAKPRAGRGNHESAEPTVMSKAMQDAKRPKAKRSRKK